MKLDKAIERLKHLLDYSLDSDTLDAIKLGIEALKGIQALRRGKGRALAELLPGETK